MVARTKKAPELPVEGYPRPYMRDGVPGLPIERQHEMLAALGLDLSEGKIYVDRISRKRVSARPPLPFRDQAVSPDHSWQRGETVYLPGFRVLGWDNLDTMRAATIAFEKGCRIYCADTGAVYSADTPADEMIKALTRAEEARRRARTTRATDGAAEAREARLAAGLAIAREHWDGPMPTAQIVKLSGLGTRTLYDHLPTRRVARERKRKSGEHV